MTAIEVYADIWCPFAHVGLRAVLRRRSELGRDDLVLHVRAWPLELVNGAPLDAATTAEHVTDLRAQVAPDLFTGFNSGDFPSSSLPALAVAAAAYRRGERIGEAVSFALRDVLFEVGEDISRPDVLSRIAAAHGLGPVGPEDEQSIFVDWREGQARGVKGSPHFFCGEHEVFCPSLDIAKDQAGHLQVSRNLEALDAFLAECL